MIAAKSHRIFSTRPMKQPVLEKKPQCFKKIHKKQKQPTLFLRSQFDVVLAVFLTLVIQTSSKPSKQDGVLRKKKATPRFSLRFDTKKRSLFNSYHPVLIHPSYTYLHRL